MGKSDVEEALMFQIRVVGIPLPLRNHRFALPDRKWELDLIWPGSMVAVEVQGGLWILGRHVQPEGYENDCRKANEAVRRGWKLYRVTPSMIKSGEALRIIEAALEGAG